MYPLTLPDTRTRDLPTRWGEVSLGQAARLAELPEGADSFSLLSVFLNLSPLEVMNLPADFVNEQVLPILDFTSAGDFSSLSQGKRPRSILLPAEHGPVCLPVPTDLTLATFGQATDLGALLQDAAMPVPEKRLRALAILLYPIYQGAAYDSDAVPAFADEVCAYAQLEQALPLTDFFLTSSPVSVRRTSLSSKPSPSAPTSERPGWRSWWRSGTSWLWSTRWLAATKPVGTSSGA